VHRIETRLDGKRSHSCRCIRFCHSGSRRRCLRKTHQRHRMSPESGVHPTPHVTILHDVSTVLKAFDSHPSQSLRKGMGLRKLKRDLDDATPGRYSPIFPFLENRVQVLREGIQLSMSRARSNSGSMISLPCRSINPARPRRLIG
jgi:hypothetical protein